MNQPKKDDPNKKHYFSVLSRQEVELAAEEIMAEKSPVRVWPKGKSEKAVEEYEISTFEKDKLVLVVKSKGSFLSILSASGLAGKEIFVKVGQGKNQYFTVTTLQYDKDTRLYRISLAGEVYKSQQRSNYRLMANSFNNIQFKMNEIVFEGLDISAGGTSFLVDATDKELYAKEKRFGPCTLRFNRMNFDIPVAKIAATWDQFNPDGSPSDKLKIGVAFEQLRPDVDEALFKHINSEARAEEMRKLMMKDKSK
jgi:hypothetical protein